MTLKVKKIISVVLSVLIVFSMSSVALAAGASNVTVKIISFMRGEEDNLRSSELLEAHVEGYDGNVRELTYKWKNTLGTYLYVYNSHNMYNINNTDGEIEIHNTDKRMDGLPNMVGRTYDKEFSGVGYAWSSVYGASIKGSSSLVGTVTVEVYDKNGDLLCSDTHEGKYSNRKNTGFVTYNLDSDMDNVVLGLFEGDKRNVKDLLGESAVVHITCTESFVNDGTIMRGSEYIKLTNDGKDYYITGIKAGGSTDSEGDALVELNIKKGNCKFHNDSSGTAETTVFVFKKPTTETTETTLTLTGNLDDRCDYFIDGVEGVRQGDKIVFTGLTPNTSYTVEVRGEYLSDGKTKYAYAYVYDTTKPVYQATVNTYLDGVKTDISEIHGADVTLYLHEDKDGAEYISLEKGDVGTYTAAVTNGIYYPWHIEAGDHEHMAREYKLIIENANGELNLHHYSVKYDTNGGAFKQGEEVSAENYSSMSSVNATDSIPVRDGFIFAGWEFNGKTYAPGKEVVASISSPIILKAKWEKSVNVTINVTIDHRYEKDGQKGYDHNEDKDELTVDFLEQTKDSPALMETGNRLYFRKDAVIDENGDIKSYKCTSDVDGEAVLVTRYTATAPTYENLPYSSYFGVALSKSGYDVGDVKKVKDADGNWVIDIPLTYNPDDFDIEFSVEMAEGVPPELFPDAVIVKIACWENNEWTIISQQRTTDKTIRPGVRVDIDPETGKGFGSYPVWKYDSDNNPYGYRAVVTGFVYDNSTIVVPTEKNHTDSVIAYTDGNYTATMGDISEGKVFGDKLYGAYFDGEKQSGELHGVIDIEKYNVIFDAQGGKINGKDKDVAAGQYYVPSFDGYQPVMPEHKFLGWYLDAQCTVPATERALLTEDVTLYAYWDRVLTGNLIADGYFIDVDGEQHIVNSPDRATHALVELEEVTSDGTYNIAGQVVEIIWSEGEHCSKAAEYKFTGLDPRKTYRIDVYLVNYDTLYQNYNTVINGNGDIHDDYYPDDYLAVYTDDNKYDTFVNTFMKFNPEVYFQPVEVDSTRIGEGYRPQSALVEYFGRETGTDKEYNKIVQHKSEPYGVEVGLNSDGLNDKEYGCYVWKEIFNGNLYDYQANLSEINGEDVADWPVIVSYGDPARWSPYSQAPTAPLKVTLIPRWYYVIYDWNDGSDYTESVSRGHIWSHNTIVDYVAEKEGYNFLGWYSNPECTGDPVENIGADVHEDTRLYAKWEKTSLTVKHIDKARNTILATETDTSVKSGDIKTAAEYIRDDFYGYTYVSSDAETIEIGHGVNEISLYYTDIYAYSVFYYVEGTEKQVPGSESKIVPGYFGDEITEYAEAFDNYVLSDDYKKTITIDKDNNIIIFYYAQDSVGKIIDDRVVSDGIADKYQKKIIFKVVNGTWNDGTEKEIIKYVTLEKDGKYDVNGTASLNAPTGMKADEGYENGSWDVTPPENVSGTDDEVYVYSFSEKPTTQEPDLPVTPDEPVNPDTPVGGGSSSGEIKHNIVFGKTDGIGWYKVSKDGGKTFDTVFGNSTYEVEQGTEIIVKVGDLMGDSFTFYVNGQAFEPDDNGNLVITVNGYMLIGALGYKVEVPDAEKSLNWFQKIIKAIKDFFAWLFGKK